MTDLAVTRDAQPDDARLRELLALRQDGLSERAIAEAVSIGPEAAGDVVSSLIETACRTGAGLTVAVRAIWLARELRLARPVAALTRCVEQPAEGHALCGPAMCALSRIGRAATASLLAAYDRCGGRDERSRLAEALALTDEDDGRVRAALVRTLEEDPERGAPLLERRGEWRALPDLLRTFDRLARAPIADCVLCEAAQLSAVGSAVRALGGLLSEAQLAALEEVLERGAPLWTAGPDAFGAHAPVPAPATAPARPSERPGRNDPCPCGSGKKYKRCHLEEDERNALA